MDIKVGQKWFDKGGRTVEILNVADEDVIWCIHLDGATFFVDSKGICPTNNSWSLTTLHFDPEKP